MGKKSIIKGALILTFANIITKLLGFIFRVYMSNLIGAEGMGLFQLIMPLYMLVWSISSSGFSTTISKLVSEENAKRNYGNSKLILSQSLVTSVLIAIALSVILFIYSDYIALTFLKDSRITLSLKIMCVSFPFMAAGSCIRGYFFGLQENVVPAVSQVLEQVSKMCVIYLLSFIFIPLGISYASAIAIIGMCTGEIFSFLYVYLAYKNKSKNFTGNISIKKSDSYFKILKTASPLTANRVTVSFLTTIENILIPQKLKAFGYTEKEAMSVFGQLSGMAMPLIMFPSSLLTSLSISMVPAISEALAIKNMSSIKDTVSKTFLFTSIIGIGTSGIFMTFANELGTAIYNQNEIGDQLFLMSFICPFIYLQATLSGILNGLGEQFFIFKNNLFSSFINILFIFFIVPSYGINGFVFSYLISLLIVNVLGLKKIHKTINFDIDVYTNILKPILCISSSCLVSKIIYKYMFYILNPKLSLVFSVAFLGLFYLIALISLDCIKISDLKLLKAR